MSGAYPAMRLVVRSFSHTGFTGTCLWMDPFSKTFYVYLSSRLHGTDPKTDSRQVYDTMGTEAALCVLNFDFFEVTGGVPIETPKAAAPK
jgi:CubicO group peptidase (beta-lactamase class C family)